jgi:arsenate reductase
VVEHEDDGAFEIGVTQLGRCQQQVTDEITGGAGTVAITGVIGAGFRFVSGHTLIMPPVRWPAMDPLTVYVHPHCSKSRTALSLLDHHHARFTTVNYLEAPPDAETIGGLLDMLGRPPADLVRIDDERFGQLGLQATDVADRAGVIKVLVAHPELMQRPVVVRGNRAVVARPPELVIELLG